MAITNYQSITDLFDVPIERMRDLKTRWVDDKETLSLEELKEIQHYMILGKKKNKELWALSRKKGN